MIRDAGWSGLILGGMLSWSAGCATKDFALPARPEPTPCVEVAKAVWTPMSKTTPPAEPATIDGRNAVRLPCPFSQGPVDRMSWDVPVRLDLSAARALRFSMRCDNLAPVSSFSLYVRSRGGWYHATFGPGATGAWQDVTVDLASARPEGTPAGWGHVEALRFSAWRAAGTDTSFYIGDVRPVGVPGDDVLVAILRADSVAQQTTNALRSVHGTVETLARMFRANGVGCAVLSDLEATPERLAKFRIVALPYNPKVPAALEDDLVRYAAGGGKLMAFFWVPEKLRAVLGVEGGAFVRQQHAGSFSAIRLAKDAPQGAPEIVRQNSHNIQAFAPTPGAGWPLAEWLDARGEPAGHAAIVGSSNGMVMTHILLPDDPEAKGRMMRALAGGFAPEIWRQIVEDRLASIATDIGFPAFDEAVSGIRRLDRWNWRVYRALSAARSARAASFYALDEGRYPDAAERADASRKKLLEALCAAQPPTPLKFRAFWCHDAYGVKGIDWDEAVRRLADNGFTAIVPNMLWGGSTFFPGKVLPVAEAVGERGDAVAACLAACRKYGVEIHVWKVNWNLGHAVPKEFVARMHAEGRLQANSRGKEEPWLCPSHPENRKLETDSMVEVARNYPVDGIHFDYIRYPDADHCFCAGCRERFGQTVGAKVENWPKDVLRGGALVDRWLDWRRENINAVVEAVSREARAVRPGIKISAAVFREWETDRDGVGQDWKLWCDKGWLDFVCPMDYMESNLRFENTVARQVKWAGRVPCYPGIGVSASSSRFGAAKTIDQIRIAERYNTGGFIIFNYGVAESRDLLPLLGLGITRPAR